MSGVSATLGRAQERRTGAFEVLSTWRRPRPDRRCTGSLAGFCTGAGLACVGTPDGGCGRRMAGALAGRLPRRYRAAPAEGAKCGRTPGVLEHVAGGACDACDASDTT